MNFSDLKTRFQFGSNNNVPITLSSYINSMGNTGNSNISMSTLFPSLSNATNIYACRSFNSNYTGPSLQIRRSSDNTVADAYMNLAGNVYKVIASGVTTIGSNALSTWMNGSPSYVSIWYDQTSSSNHLRQTTNSSQPVYDSNLNMVYINGSNNNQVGLSYGNTVSLMDFSLLANIIPISYVNSYTQPGSTTAWYFQDPLFGGDIPGGASDFAICLPGGSNFGFGAIDDNSANFALTNGFNSNAVMAFTRSGVSGTYSIYKDGILSASGVRSGQVNVSLTTNNPLYVGMDKPGTDTTTMNGKLSALVYYSSTCLSAANISSISYLLGNNTLGDPVLNFDASSLSSVGVGNAITTWTNNGIMGTNYNATAYNSPKLGRVNGVNHVSFVAANLTYFNINTSFPMTWFNNSGIYAGMTIFVVAQFTDSTNMRNYVRFIDFGGGTNGTVIYRYGTSAQIGMDLFNETTQVGTNIATYTNDKNYHIFIFNVQNSSSGNTINTYFDSTTIISSTSSSITPINNKTTTSAYNFIGNSTSNNYLNANIRQILMYKYAMSSSDMATVFNTLKSKWNMITPTTLPPSAMTANSTILCNDTYIASSSSGSNPWYAFGKLTYNGNASRLFQSAANYDNTGTYIGSSSTTSSGTIYTGEWIQLQIPNPTLIGSYWINSTQGSSPYTVWTLAGSTDGSTWTTVDALRVYSTGLASAITVTPSTSFSYYRLIFKQMCPTITTIKAYNVEFYQ